MRRIMVVLIVILSLLISTTGVFAASNPNVIIANPVDGSTLYSSNLLISVKITKPTTVRVSAFKQMKTVNSTQVAITYEDLVKAEKDKVAGKEVAEFSDLSVMSETTTTTNDLTFYTKKLENVSPAIYKIRVETIGADGKATHKSESIVNIKDKSEEAKAASADQSQPGAVQFLQNLLKSIFGN